ncbi:DNA cytosine methyltransferase [Paenibacillus taichungensis]
MKDSIMKRLYKIKERLYIEAKYLADYGFGIGQPIAYEIDQTKQRVTIVPAENSKKHVARTTQKTGKTVPVIDIKSEDVKALFAGNQTIQLEVQQDRIVFTVLAEAKSVEKVVSLDDARSEKVKLEEARFSISVNEFARAANFSTSDLFGLFRASRREVTGSSFGNIVGSLKQKAITMLSLFSGCGSMDKGFLDEKYEIVFANDRFEKKALRSYHLDTYRHNIGNHIIMRDVMEFREKDVPEVDFVCAGVPCVTFSALNTINNFRDSKSILHPIVEQTINIIQWSKAKAFLIENVANFLSVKGGLMLERFKERLSDFGIVAKIINATSLGSAQSRTRSFILGIKDYEPELSLPPVCEVNTVRDAFANIEGVSQQDLFFKPTEKTLERMKYVPQGGNVNDVPVELRAPNKRFSNYLQRLAWDSFSPTITHVQDEAFTHPEKDRYLTVRETARLFSLPDSFFFCGSLTAIFEQLKNCVDYRVSRFLAKEVKRQLQPLL